VIRISYTDPSGKPQSFATEAPAVLIGRRLPFRPDQLGLDDEKVSSRHARISYENGEFWIEDLGSTNGTWVDKRKIKPNTKIRLAAGAAILIGKEELRIEASPLPSCGPPDASSAAVGHTPKESVEAGAPLPDLFLAGGSLEAARQRLSAVYEMSTSLGEIEDLDHLAAALLDQVQRAFPKIRRNGHCGLLLGSDLALKSFRPEDESPACSVTLARHVWAQKKGCLWQVDSPGGVDKSSSLFTAGIQSAMYAPLLWKGEVQGVLYLDVTSRRSLFDIEDLRLLQIIAGQAAMFLKNLALQQAIQREVLIKTRLLAQFPRPIAERLARHPGRLAIANERVEAATVLFSDVRGFTKLAFTMEPEHVVQMLNDMFHDLTPIVLKNQGTVDKDIGDAILAVFGCPDPDEQQWEHAVGAALEMQAAVRSLGSTRWTGRPAFRIGIGIHTGPVIHGFIGAAERVEYTVIGDTINAASRYCDAAAPEEILISPSTYAHLHHRVEVDLPAREIDTKHEGKMKAYLVRGWKGTRKI
jgi:adenylate cyclase